ncbi:hypothetical protein BVY02_01870, partial [bacterium J17]
MQTSAVNQVLLGALLSGNNKSISAALSQMSEGDILKLTVAQNPKSGAGTLLFKGQSFQANLPPHLNAGDKLLAQLTSQGQVMSLDILEVLPTSTPAPNSSGNISAALSSVASQLESLLSAQGEKLL